MSTPNLAEIVEKVRTDSAFEVYVAGGGVEDELNDVRLVNAGFKEKNYIRAVWNVKKNNSYERRTDLATMPKLGNFSICRMVGEDLVKREPSLDNVGIVAYGPMKYTEKVERKVGWFRKVQERVERKSPLSSYLRDGDNRDAYFVRFVINADVPDGCGRKGGEKPILTLIGTKQLVEQIVGYIRQNPSEYRNLLEAILPAEGSDDYKFPQVNSGILGRMGPVDRIALLDAEKKPRGSLANKLKRYAEWKEIQRAG